MEGRFNGTIRATWTVTAILPLCSPPLTAGGLGGRAGAACGPKALWNRGSRAASW